MVRPRDSKVQNRTLGGDRLKGRAMTEEEDEKKFGAMPTGGRRI